MIAGEVAIVGAFVHNQEVPMFDINVINRHENKVGSQRITDFSLPHVFVRLVPPKEEAVEKTNSM